MFRELALSFAVENWPYWSLENLKMFQFGECDIFFWNEDKQTQIKRGGTESTTMV